MAKDVGNTSDPYFKIKLKSQSWRSPVVYKTLNPVYDASTGSSCPRRIFCHPAW